MTKNSVCHTSYLRNHILYDCHLWYTCIKWWYVLVFFFFHFLKILIFRVSVVKGQKIIKMKKIFFFLSHSISQEPYIMCLSFLVEKSEMMISPGIFSFFQNFYFSGDLVKKRMTLLHLFASSFQNVIFCEILWLTSRRKNYVSEIDQIFIYRKNQVYWIVTWLCRSIFIVWKNVVNFCVANFYLIFSEGHHERCS